MALNFNVEALSDKIVIHVKGNVIELSYHSASCLCRNIIEACERRHFNNLTKYRYWVDRYKHKRKVKPNKDNREEYERFLATVGDDGDLEPSKKGAGAGRKKKNKPMASRARLTKEDERKAAMQAKIRELQERYHITPTNRRKDGDNK